MLSNPRRGSQYLKQTGARTILSIADVSLHRAAMSVAERSWKYTPMKPNLADELADRDAEERSENEGMPEHPAKSHDPVRWTEERSLRTGRRAPERWSDRGGNFGRRPDVVCRAGRGWPGLRRVAADGAQGKRGKASPLNCWA